METIISIYLTIIAMGVLGNLGLGLRLWCGPGAKSRSPFLLGLIAADLLVCSLSGPLTASLYGRTPCTTFWGRVMELVQAWPVSASTLCMMGISVERYLTVKNYRPTGHVASRRTLLTIAVFATWISAALLSGIQLFPQQHAWRKSLILSRVVLVHVMPACAVLVSHLGVHAKLTALSLTARAKHGELPLPMPILRKPSNLIVVAGINKTNENMEDMTQPRTSTLQSRRRLANLLLFMAVVFVLFWLPYIVCQFVDELGSSFPENFLGYSLLLGHIHSALSPILYWVLNHQWPKPCKFRFTTIYRSASSTNEAALGPFNPVLVRPPPKRRRSSEYLY